MIKIRIPKFVLSVVLLHVDKHCRSGGAQNGVLYNVI